MSTPGRTPKRDLYIGLMSGTSIDAVDATLVRCDADGVALLATCEHPIEESLRDRIAAISHPGAEEIQRMGALDRELGRLFATAVRVLLEQSGHRAPDIAAIGSHGQTIRHQPPSVCAPGQAFTLQIGDPNTISELTGITTVADFRRRDVAAGGEGAPLAPAFHAAAFSSAGSDRAVINIGGIANATLLQGDTLYAGFDTGPGNTLLDQWIRRHRGEPCDRNGHWAAGGTVDPQLLERLLQHPFLGGSGPRSTGKEAFNLPWLDSQLGAASAGDPADVQATLAEFTARSIAAAIRDSGLAPGEIYLCGGGSHNLDLVGRLSRQLPDATMDTTDALGIDPDWVEGAAFAWLASRTVAGLAGNAPVVTGAAGERVLGAIYPA